MKWVWLLLAIGCAGREMPYGFHVGPLAGTIPDQPTVADHVDVNVKVDVNDRLAEVGRRTKESPELFVWRMRAEMVAVFEDGQLGVVTGARPDGTVEFLYVERGVIRRGFHNRAQPSTKRDRQGRILNTFLRPYKKGDPTDQKYLAGELLVGFR